ncbi:uncharacterized protein IL334_001326 [Kwoniella shivajii]|uniref:LITAF domain-containing protein n=1 Tax=Kwoniella shivajii TaxID=564305 RepID=A0ABZ1CSQ4_9TREE|nr:hypothetical protein IL334_001326 [Kwoniella shivajii]
MYFFPPTMYPDGSFSSHLAVHPPPHPCSGGLPFSGQASIHPDNPSQSYHPVYSPPRAESSLESRPVSAPISASAPAPGPPPAPAPAPASDVIPISHSHQQGLPLLIPNAREGSEREGQGEIPYSYIASHSPPRYLSSSPPIYKALPSPSEGTLLLAPPPNFYASTCPLTHAHAHSHSHSHSHSLSELPTHSCPHCFTLHHHQSDTRLNELVGNGNDWVITLLILLNFLVWGAVGYGYWCEYTQGTRWDGLGDIGRIGWWRFCDSEECHWAFVDY